MTAFDLVCPQCDNHIQVTALSWNARQRTGGVVQHPAREARAHGPDAGAGILMGRQAVSDLKQREGG